ncbi:hypothetical protein K438DRAFT_1772238 [Mycena galopus ATCC 62051]|nr:hypothetical protein K438DRAFT_1772238 [Mycena galopus ATCC 62051]
MCTHPPNCGLRGNHRIRSHKFGFENTLCAQDIVFNITEMPDVQMVAVFRKCCDPRGELLYEAALFIWDEAPMANRAVLACVDDDLLRRIMGNALLFGDKVVDASIKSSRMFSCFTVARLIEPIRNAEDLEFAAFVDAIGDSAGPEIQLHMLQTIYPEEEPATFVYLTSVLVDPLACLKRAILAPTNQQVASYILHCHVFETGPVRECSCDPEKLQLLIFPFYLGAQDGIRQERLVRHRANPLRQNCSPTNGTFAQGVEDIRLNPKKGGVGADGQEFFYDVLVLSPGSTVRELRGQIKVNSSLQLLKHPDIFALGDTINTVKQKQLMKASAHAAIVAKTSSHTFMVNR